MKDHACSGCAGITHTHTCESMRSVAPCTREPGDQADAALPRFVRMVRALLRHTNPFNVNEGHSQQWWAVNDECDKLASAAPPPQTAAMMAEPEDNLRETLLDDAVVTLSDNEPLYIRFGHISDFTATLGDLRRYVFADPAIQPSTAMNTTPPSPDAVRTALSTARDKLVEDGLWLTHPLVEQIDAALNIKPSQGVVQEASFLLDRLEELDDANDAEYTREFEGHVRPSMSRLRRLLSRKEHGASQPNTDALCTKDETGGSVG